MTAAPAADGDVITDIVGPVARVLINRPQTRNALSPAVVEGIRAAVDAAAAAGCLVLVIAGAGGTLSSGADLSFLRSIRHDAARLRSYITSIGETFERLAAAPFVSIGVVEQYALAGGCELLLACDLAVVSEQALIGDRHLEYGLLPGAGGSVRLPRAVAPAIARRLLFTGEMMDGATAARAGLVSHAVPGEQVTAAADALAARLARHSQTALTQIKRLYRTAAAASDLEAEMDHERDTLIRHLSEDPAVSEGLAAFAQKRLPDFAPFRAAPAETRP